LIDYHNTQTQAFTHTLCALVLLKGCISAT